MRPMLKLVQLAAIVAAGSGCGGATAATASHDDGGNGGDASSRSSDDGGSDGAVMDSTVAETGNDSGRSGTDATTDGSGGTDGASVSDAQADGLVGPDGCMPATCASLGYTCGIATDPCGGGLLTCGCCSSPEYCGGGGVNKCGGNLGDSGCTPITCASVGIYCGTVDDGCGQVLDCGTCTAPEFCGGGGPNKCGTSDASFMECTPTTCQRLGFDCGFAGDGCGGLLFCGCCSNPQYCGGGGVNKCGGNLDDSGTD